MKFDRIKFSLPIAVVTFLVNHNSVLAQEIIERLPAKNIKLELPIQSFPTEEQKMDTFINGVPKNEYAARQQKFLLVMDSCQRVTDLLNERYSGRNFFYYVSTGYGCNANRLDPSKITIVKEEKWRRGSQHKTYYQDDLWDGLYFQEPIR